MRKSPHPIRFECPAENAIELPDDLLTWKELATQVWNTLRIKLTPSKLCVLRAKGLPSIPVEARGFRYQYGEVAKWLLQNARRKHDSATVDAFNQATAKVRALNPRPHLGRVSGSGV